MKKTLITLICLISISMNAQDLVIPTFLEKWENSKNYLLEIAEAMPEDKYSYKPTERQMEFKQQLSHIRANMLWLSNSYFLDKKGIKEQGLEIEVKSKAEIIKLLSESFDTVTEIIKNAKPEDLGTKVKFFAGPKTKLQILNLLQDHVTHHRGQLLVYLNLNEIKPPRFIGW